MDQKKQESESNGDMNMFGFPYGYCLYHSYTDAIFLDDIGVEFHNHFIGDDVAIECRGPFVRCDPPPQLSEEEWQHIISTEDTIMEDLVW